MSGRYYGGSMFKVGRAEKADHPAVAVTLRRTSVWRQAVRPESANSCRRSEDLQAGTLRYPWSWVRLSFRTYRCLGELG